MTLQTCPLPLSIHIGGGSSLPASACTYWRYITFSYLSAHFLFIWGDYTAPGIEAAFSHLCEGEVGLGPAPTAFTSLHLVVGALGSIHTLTLLLQKLVVGLPLRIVCA